MESITNYSFFILTAFLLNITPGVDTFYIISRSISQGKLAGVVSVFGISTGSFFHAMAAAFGLSVLLVTSSLAFTIIKYIGAVYLTYIGISMIIKSKKSIFETYKPEKCSIKKVYVQGLLTNIFNPKVSLFFLALIPQFVNPSSQEKILPFLILGFTFIVTGTIWCLLVAYLSSSLSNFFKKSNKSNLILNYISGIILVILGINLALEKK